MKKRLLFQFLLAAFSTFVNAQIPVPAPADQTLKPKLNPNTDPRNQQMPAPAPTPAPVPQKTPPDQGSARSNGNQSNTRTSSSSKKEQTAVTPAQPEAAGKGDPAAAASNPVTEKQPAESATAAAKRQLIADGFVVCMTHPEYGKVYCKKGQKQPTKYFYIDEDGIATPIDPAAVENTAEATKPVAPAKTTPEMVRVSRWVSPVVGDFVSIPESHATDAQLISWGYKSKIFQFEAYRTRPEGENVTTVNLWEMGTCKEFILIAEHEISDAKMTEWGYKNKQFAFYAYRIKPASGNFVAVSRWVNALPAGNACKDFTLSIAENELTDAQLTSYGYTSKIMQFYVPAP